MTTYRSACHCGGVRLEIETDRSLGPLFRCNCSLCARKGAVIGAAPLDAVTVVAGETLISTYAWNTREAQHHFCRVCGIHTHHRMRGRTDMVGLNMACIEGFDVADFGDIPTDDGKGEWSVVPDTRGG